MKINKITRYNLTSVRKAHITINRNNVGIFKGKMYPYLLMVGK